MNHYQFAASSVVRSVFLIVLLVMAPPSFADGFDPCSIAVPVEIDSTLRGYVDLAGEPQYVKLQLSSSGLLAVSITASAAAATEPVLGFAGFCDGGIVPTVVDSSSSHQVLLASAPGGYLFRVASPDTSPSLGRVKLSNSFVPDVREGGAYRDGEDEEEIEIEPEGVNQPVAPGFPWAPKDGEDEEEIEIEPEGVNQPATPGFPWAPKDGEDEEEIEIEPEGVNQPVIFPGGLWNPRDGEDEEEIEIEPEGVNQLGWNRPGSRSLYGKLDQLCRRATSDDHGDSFACSTLLSPGQDVTGTIGNGEGDDVDVFQIVLGGSDLWRLQVAGVGDVEIFTGLYDRTGHRLEWADGSGGDTNVVRMLHPGTYFVKVESPNGAEGSYALGVEASAW